MGFISNLAKAAAEFPGQGRGRALWDRTFGTAKEDKKPNPSAPGGSWTRSTLSSDAATKRFIEALRSRAPGGWTDDRYEQTLRHFVGITYAAIDRISRQLAQSEVKVYVKDENHPDGKRLVTRNDTPHGDRVARPWDLVDLLEKPNKQDSFGKWMWRASQQLRLTGTAYTYMLPNALGTPMELYCIPTAIAIPQPVVSPEFPDGYFRIQPLYPYGPFSSWPTPATAVGAPIGAQWMLKFQYPHPLFRYDGYSPLTAGRQHIDEVESIDRSRWYSMKRGINPSAVLNFAEMEGTAPLPEEEIARIEAYFENEQQGPENTGRLFVATPGAELAPWGTSPKEMDYQTGWDQLVSFVLGGIFGITKQAAGMIEDSSYATLFATLKQLHLITLVPDCNDIGSDLTRHLAPFFGDDLIVKVECPRIDDHEIKKMKVDTLITAKAITKNEVRKEFELAPTKEEWGNEIAGHEDQPGFDPATGKPMDSPAEEKAASPFSKPGDGGEAKEAKEPEEAKAPTPGPLGTGSLGPRKSFYEHLRGAFHATNGSGNTFHKNASFPS